jgi:uncharacterized protein (TIGR03086 family)
VLGGLLHDKNIHLDISYACVDRKRMRTDLPDIRPIHERAVRASVAAVSRLTPADLSRATPCADWDLADLVAHMTAQHHGFAVAAAGNDGDLRWWRPRPLGGDPVRAYADAAERALAAFAPDEVLDREFVLPEIGRRPIPARQAIGFHFIDYVVHGWDVAASLRIPFTVDAEVLRTALPIAEAVPDGERRRVPGAAFAPRLPSSAGDDPLAQVLALLGRSPRWPDS